MMQAVHGIEATCGSGRNRKKRKMFSHREHGFPTVGAEAKDKDWLTWEASSRDWPKFSRDRHAIDVTVNAFL